MDVIHFQAAMLRTVNHILFHGAKVHYIMQENVTHYRCILT